MRQLGISVDDRKCVKAALEKAELTGTPSMALEFPDGTIITSKTSDLLGASAALLLNALKHLAGIRDKMLLLSKNIIKPIQDLKIKQLGNHNPRLHSDEVLIALAICATTNTTAELALSQLDKLRGCQVHSTVMLPSVDVNVFKKLGINLTCEPNFYAKKLYRK